MIFWFWWACQPEPTPLTKSVSILLQVVNTPEQTLSICSPLESTDLELYNECLSIGSQDVSSEHKVTLCQTMTGTWQQECFFEMAERTNQSQYCDEAGSFKTDCYSHILQMSCGQFQSAKSLLQFIDKLELSLTSSIEHLAHRCILSNKPSVPILECASFPSVSECETLATEFYRQRMTRNTKDICRAKKNNAFLRTSNHPKLLSIYEETYNEHCHDQD